MKSCAWALVGLASASAGVSAQTTAPAQPVASAAGTPFPAVSLSTLLAGTPVTVMTNDEISTMSCNVGERFEVTVVRDVVSQGVVVIPAGTIGGGEVTFCTNRGGFGKPGILGIALRDLQLGGKRVALDGRYREEGGNGNAATAVTWFAAGIVSGLIKGKKGVIPKGRELRARTGEDIVFAPGTMARAVTIDGPMAVAATVGAGTTVAAAGNGTSGGDGKEIPQAGSK